MKTIHKECLVKTKIAYLADAIEGKKKEPSPKIKRFFDDVIKQYDDIIEKLSEDRMQFIEYTNMFGLSKEMINMVNLIKNDDLDKINGKLIHSICHNLENEPKTQTAYLPSFQN